VTARAIIFREIPMQTVFALLFWILLMAANGVRAEDAIVKHRATLRNDPSTQHPPVGILEPDEDVELIEPNPTANYYRVRTGEGEEGWIYARSIEIVAGPPSVAPASAPLAAPALQPTLTGGVVSQIPTNWERPEPDPTTFDGPDGHCGPTGDGGDIITNKRKNRTDVPTAYHLVTWKAVETLPYPVAKKSLTDWTPDQIAQIAPYQGIAASVVGYLAAIKPQHGSGESTNCHFTNPVEVDWHIPLVEKAGDAEATSIVVETTPRVRKLHPKWTPQALASWVNSDAPVRISGWTMLDPEHRAHLGKYRSTLWEIHPITKIEVFKDGQWSSADDLP
jgi:hypothetical protein